MTKKDGLLLLIDAHAVIYRAYHAIPPLSSPSGEPTNATFGFVSTLLKVLSDFDPEGVAVAFDVGRTFRHEGYAEYKAGRPEPTPDLIAQFNRVRDVVQAFGIPDYSKETFEADDVLATLADQARAQGCDVVIVTGDSDTFQLVRPGIRVYILGRRISEGTLYDEAAIKERYGLEPAQLIDLKGLAGDTSDNIPGVSGIGEKSATTLLQRYGSVEAIYERLDEVEKRWQAKLAEGRESAFRSKELVRLVHDVPVKLDLAACSRSNYDRQRVMGMFRELGFYRLTDRLPGQAPAATGQLSLFGAEEAPALKAAAAPSGQYQVVDTPEALDDLAAKLRAAGRFAVDVETTGLDPLLADLVGISVAAEPGTGYYIPVGHAAGMGRNLPLELVREVLGPLLADPKVAKYAHNAGFDLAVLLEQGMPAQGLAADTLIAAFLLNPDRSVGLKQLAWERYGVEMTEITELIGKGRNQVTMAQVPVAQAAPYAAADADMTVRLAEPLLRELEERQLTRLYREVELPLVPVLIEMERHGVALDVPFLAQMSKDLERQLGELEERIYQAAGRRFNINSTQQLGQLLFEQLGLPAPRRTKTGYSTDIGVMESLRGQHPVVEAVIQHRQLSKIKSTYADALPALVNPRTGRVHTSYNQTGAVTGRLSSSNPNLQNIPVRTELGREVRRAFVAPAGSWLLEADYSQVELRILAHVADDPALKEAFWRGEDIHASTAAAILGVPLPEVTSDMRRIAKSINFGLIYGMSGFGLAARTGLSPA